MASSTDSRARTLYITCYHAQEYTEGNLLEEKGEVELACPGWKSIFDWFPIRGLKTFRSGLTAGRPLIKYKWRTIIVSSNGEYIAILYGNQVTVLTKKDNFIGTVQKFTAFPKSRLLLSGVWVDGKDVLVVSDSSNTLYFLKPTAERLEKIADCKLQLSGIVIGLLECINKKTQDSCEIGIVSSDCNVQWVLLNGQVVTLEQLNSKGVKQSQLKKYHPYGLSCCHFNRDHSLVVLAGPAMVADKNSCALSVWMITGSSELDLVFHRNVTGTLAFLRGHLQPLVAPKVNLSPCGKYIALLDLGGDLHFLELDKNFHFVSEISCSAKNGSEIADKENSDDPHKIIDFSWWSKGKIVVAKADGYVTLLDIYNRDSLFEETPKFSCPVLGKSSHKDGEVFVLDSIYPKEICTTVDEVAPDSFIDKEITTECGWRLISLLERSVSEMYRILIDGQNFESALHFAAKHNLDKDEVYKAQWMHSEFSADSVSKILMKVNDRFWVLSECLNKIGLTVDAVHSVLSHGLSLTEDDRSQDLNKDCPDLWHIRLARLRLLQYSDRLYTFLAVNMSRFSPKDYAIFRKQDLLKIASSLAEKGKIGSLSLLWKRHTYSLAPVILSILNAVPETVPVDNYSELLPGLSPPVPATSRDEDWVENTTTLNFIETKWHDNSEDIDPRASTEYMVKLHMGLRWPSAVAIVDWYKERARTIDRFSGQLENCLTLLDIGYNKGFVELRALFEDTSDLCRLVFCGGEMNERDLDLSLSKWEGRSDYEKFKTILNGVSEATVVDRLREMAIPFVHRKFTRKDHLDVGTSSFQDKDSSDREDSFIVKWLKEVSEGNNLELCSVVLEEGCKETDISWLFKDEIEINEVGLHCVYACTYTDRWGLMASILSKLPRKLLRVHSATNVDDFTYENGSRDVLSKTQKKSHYRMPSNERLTMKPMFMDEDKTSCEQVKNLIAVLERKLKIADGHVEAGRILAQYQVPKPIQYFVEAHNDEKVVKQLLRLLLSKFGRRQPGRSDSDWAMMWRDMLCLQEKAFPFLDTEYLLSEFCRGLLKAGKFSLARNYLRGTASTSLSPEKAETLVVQAAREYFFSASSLDSSEIWKAKECLDLFPNSKQIKVEADIIDAITVKLPRLGVTLLPMQFRQIRDPMDIVKMAINSQLGAYLKPDELIELACLLGLNSSDDIAMVEAAIAREAGAIGDFQLAADLCLVLAKKNHGSVWDLCAALARGPDIEKLGLQSRKELLGFALCHCDDESIGELLNVWKDLDIATRCESLGNDIGKKMSTFSDEEALASSFPVNSSKNFQKEDFCTAEYDQSDNPLNKLRDDLLSVSQKFSPAFDWGAFISENKKFMAFAALQLPWLLDLHKSTIKRMKGSSNIHVDFAKETYYIHTRAAAVIMYWLSNYRTIPKDYLIEDFARIAFERPSTPDCDILGCSYLLNLSDSYRGVDIIDDALRARKDYREIQSAIKMGLIFSALQTISKQSTPIQRRNLLHSMFWDRRQDVSDLKDEKDGSETVFWRSWRSRVEGKQKLAVEVQMLEQIIPGVDTKRFLSGDAAYINSTVFALAETVLPENKGFLSEASMLADAYGVSRSEVFVRYLSSLLVSTSWANEEVESEILKYRSTILENAILILKVVFSRVYAEINASNNPRLKVLLHILALCYTEIENKWRSAATVDVSEHLKNEVQTFLKSMITAGCPFGMIAQVCFHGREREGMQTNIESVPQSAEKSKEGQGPINKDAETLEIIHVAYTSTIHSVLCQLCSQIASDSRVDVNKICAKDLCNALSSLAYMFKDDTNLLNIIQPNFSMLKKIREEVWSKLVMFAEDMQVPNQVRVFVLELLQCIIGRGSVQSVDLQGYIVTPWIGWDASSLNVENPAVKEKKSNASHLKTTLVALKSTELISGFWPQKEVSGEDLSGIDSAISLFTELANHVASRDPLLSLQSLLKEWETIFESESLKIELKSIEDATRVSEGDWKEVEWDDGWESFADEKTEAHDKSGSVIYIHSLHSCWMIIFEKLIEQHCANDVLQILDQNLTSTHVLLTEDEADKLVKLLVKLDPVVALKSALLLPYNSLWFETLKIVDNNLEVHTVSDTEKPNLVDSELLALVLCAGIVPTLVSDSSYGSFFSCLCAALGRLARVQQESSASFQTKSYQPPIHDLHWQESAFSRVAFPYFVAELTRGKQFYLAGTFVFYVMHVPTVFSSINAVHSLLQKYLEMQKKMELTNVGETDTQFYGFLKHTMGRLKQKLPNALALAYCALSNSS